MTGQVSGGERDNNTDGAETISAPRRLFNEFEAMTNLGSGIFESAHDFARNLIHSYLEEGYSGRDVESVIISGVTAACAEVILRRDMELRRARRARR